MMTTNLDAVKSLTSSLGLDLQKITDITQTCKILAYISAHPEACKLSSPPMDEMTDWLTKSPTRMKMQVEVCKQFVMINKTLGDSPTHEEFAKFVTTHLGALFYVARGFIFEEKPEEQLLSQIHNLLEDPVVKGLLEKGMMIFWSLCYPTLPDPLGRITSFDDLIEAFNPPASSFDA